MYPGGCPEGIECIQLSWRFRVYPRCLADVLKVPESIWGALQMSRRYLVCCPDDSSLYKVLCRCPEGLGVYQRGSADVRKPLSVCGVLSWRCQSLYVVLCRCPEAIKCIWCTVLRILEYICSALQMSSEVFCRCPEGSGVYLGCIADAQKVPGSIWGALQMS